MRLRKPSDRERFTASAITRQSPRGRRSASPPGSGTIAALDHALLVGLPAKGLRADCSWPVPPDRLVRANHQSCRMSQLLQTCRLRVHMIGICCNALDAEGIGGEEPKA